MGEEHGSEGLTREEVEIILLALGEYYEKHGSAGADALCRKLLVLFRDYAR